MKRWNIIRLIGAGLLLVVTGCGVGRQAPAGERLVTDLVGRRVAVPLVVNRVAGVDVLALETLLTLGEADKLTQIRLTYAPWMYEVVPRLRNLPTNNGLNIEELLRQHVDVVFTYNNPKELDKLAAVGIPALVAQAPANRREKGDIADFIASQKEMVRLYGAVLGGEAAAKADEWCAYYDDRLAFVMARTQNIPASRRLRVYLVRGPSALNTHTRSGYTYWYGKIAGANMIEAGHTGQQNTIAVEDLITWDPQVIFVGRQYPLDLVRQDPKLQNLTAVRTGRVYPQPDGVFYWDGGPEAMLLAEYLAKELYPDLFPDQDLAQEVQTYYRRFYNYALTGDEADKLLQGLSPDGTRENAHNN